MPIYSFTYSIPYLCFLFVLVVLMFWEFRNIKYNGDTKNIRRITMIGFVLFFGLRGFVFTDWATYYPLFRDLPTLWGGNLGSIASTNLINQFSPDFNTENKGVELGFVFFTALFKSVIPNYFAWVFLNTIIDVLILNMFFKKYSKYYVLGFIVFFVFGGLIIEINLMRNIKAILLFMISIKYLKERKIIPYMLLNILGFMFHASAIIYLPLYFILNVEWPRKLLWSIFIIGNFLFLFHVHYLEPIVTPIANLIGGRIALMVQIYFESNFYSRQFGLGLGYIERFITFLLIMFFYKKLKEQDANNIIIINAYVLYIVVYLFFAEITVAVERLSLLFVFSYWILYPNILNLISREANKKIFIFILLSYCILKTEVSNSNIFSRYDNLITGIESYDSRGQTINSYLDIVLKND